MRIKLLLLLLPFFFVLEGCSPYDDGPKISLTRKVKRLNGEWKVESIDGENVNYKYSLEFDKDGDCRYFNENVIDFYDNDKGKWKWEDGKSNISLVWEKNGSYEIQIHKLTKDEFWFDDKENKLVKCNKQ
jgi:hypothetical protein